MAEASGLAGKIRRCADSDEFDLAGKSAEACNELVKASFTEPFELTKMIKITFVCGGGKQCRQKYGDSLPRDFMIALNNIGFDQDDAACMQLSAAGRYKYQHDTSKNLLFVHVFPRVKAPEAEEGEEGEEGEEAEQGSRDPADVLAECEMDDFRRIVGSHVTTYTCRKRLLDSLRGKLSRLEEAEQKMIAREEVDPALQKLYDTLTADVLKDKMKIIGVELQSSIDNGELTAAEKTQASEALDAKLSALQADLTKAESDGKAKLQAKLEEAKEKLKTQKAAVSAAAPAPSPPMKYASEIQRLHKRIAGLNKLEKENKGNYTMDQLKALGEKPEMEEAMSIMETRSKMWFETDDELKARVKLCKQQAASAAPKKSSGGGYPAANKSDGWATVKKK